MSERFPGGIISKTAPVPTGPFETGTAPGVWTLDQQAAFVKQGIWPIAGNALPYIEDVFSTWLYTGNGSTQTITNGIDLAGKGGLTWIKARTQPSFASNHTLFDTVRGTGKQLFSDLTSAQATDNTSLTAFNSTGFTLGSDSTGTVNWSGHTFASWTFREQPKFFDVVTYTGNGTSQAINHNLGATPGCIIVKNLTTATDWLVYHTSLGNTKGLFLNLTLDAQTATSYWNNTSPTSTNFTVGLSARVNTSGDQYVAYLFAHNAGGFGLTGTDNVISCGSFSVGSVAAGSIDIGFEPQWLLVKDLSSGYGWVLLDTMRGLSNSGDTLLFANTSGAEVTDSSYFIRPTATGFAWTANYTTNAGAIYIAIRRGPMKVPTDATKVYSANRYQYNSGYAGGLTTTTVSGAAGGFGGFPTDMVINTIRNNSGDGNRQFFLDRLRGIPGLWSTQTYSESSPAAPGSDAKWDNMVGVTTSGYPYYVYTPYSFTNYFFKRAPQFFDEVCYTGTGTSNSSINHNLGVVPELFFVKRRNAGGSGDVNWGVYSKDRPSIDFNLILNSTTGWYNAGTGGWFGTGTLSATVFPSGNAGGNFGNLSGGTYVAYLFATCPNVSKVGSYTGTGTTQTINCGFTGGARWVMIKRTDSTGDWLVWDTVSGMVAGTDNRIAMNTTAAEVNENWVYTASTGFEIVTSNASVNASGGTYIFLAIA
jgi:hypothetical protein